MKIIYHNHMGWHSSDWPFLQQGVLLADSQYYLPILTWFRYDVAAGEHSCGEALGRGGCREFMEHSGLVRGRRGRGGHSHSATWPGSPRGEGCHCRHGPGAQRAPHAPPPRACTCRPADTPEKISFFPEHWELGTMTRSAAAEDVCEHRKSMYLFGMPHVCKAGLRSSVCKLRLRLYLLCGHIVSASRSKCSPHLADAIEPGSASPQPTASHV